MSERAANSSIELVVARYREDVSWLAEVPYPTVVYDKSGAPGAHALPNIGREAHTYLHHILSRWPDFPDYTAFVQGWPFDHMAPGADPAGLVALLDALIRRRVFFKGLADYVIECDALGRPHHFFDPQSAGKWSGHGRDIPVGEVYAALFAGPVPEKYTCRAPAGAFLVHRSRILLRPRQLYETAMALVLADPDDARNTGHALERLWYLVFNGLERLNKPEWAASVRQWEAGA